MSATVRVAGLRDLSPVIRQLGGDPLQIYRECGVDPELFEDDEAIISYRKVIHLLEHTSLALGAPDLGLRLASGWQLDILGPLALAMQNSRTVEDALHCAASHLFFHSSALELEIRSDGETTDLRLDIHLPGVSHEDMPQVEDKSIGFLHRILSMLAGETYRPSQVTLSHEPLAPARIYRNFFGVPVSFSGHSNVIRANTDCLATRIRGQNEKLHRIALNYLQAQYPTPHDTVSSRVRIAVRSTLGTASCNRADIARSLGMHPRTLQRHLKSEGVSFNELRDKVRCEQAEHYLRDTQIPLAQVAGIIGYSDQSMLTRSCRRWFGETPRQMRTAVPLRETGEDRRISSGRIR